MEQFKGSLCFNIPFEVDSNNLLTEEYYKKVLDFTNNKEQNFEKKASLVEKFQGSYFPKAEPVMICPGGTTVCEEYRSRFLCHCVSVAKKFLDDRNHGNTALHFFLGNYTVNYSYWNSDKKECNFQFDLTLTFHSRIEYDGEIQAHLLLHLSFDNYSTDELIFIKHLFYKEKLQCEITDTTSKISLRDWSREQIQHLDKIIHSRKETSVNQKLDISIEVEFDNSLLEIQPIAANNPCIETDAITDAMLYGLITSDEGWRFIHPDEAAKRMQTKWSLRPFEVFYFLHSNCLILYRDQAEISKEYKYSQLNIFQKYQYVNSEGKQSRKYAKYCELSPCIPGVRSMFLFTFQDISYRRMMIIKAKKRADELLKNSNKRKSLRVKELRKHQNNLFKEIEKNVFGAPEMLNIQSILIDSFSIPHLIESLKEKYNRTIILLENENTDTTNKTIRRLTFITIGIGIIQVSISLLSAQDKCWTYLMISLAVLAAVIVAIWGISLLNKTHFRAMKEYLKEKRWIKK